MSLVAVIVAGCSFAAPSSLPSASPRLTASPASATASPSTTPAPAPTAGPTAGPTAAAYVPGPAWEPFGDPIVVNPDVTSVTTTSHGIRIRMAVESSSFAAADGLWVTTRLENVGNNVLHWITDGCATHVGVSARTAIDWSYGAAQPEPFNTFKDWALERYSNREPYPIYLPTLPEWAITKETGSFGCADLAVGHELKAGGRIDAREFVRAETGRHGNYGLPPAGPVLLTGAFGTWYRGKDDPDTVHHDSIVVTVAVEIARGRDPDFISPGQAIDAALASGQLVDAIRDHPAIPDFAPTVLKLDAAAGHWVVGVSVDRRTMSARQLTVVVDARSGEVLRYLEGPFDNDP